MKVSNRQYFGY